MSNVSQWSTTAASNNSAAPNGFPEGMAANGLNDGAREVMAAVARWYSDADGSLTSTGSSNAYVLTTNSSHSALADQSILVFKANHANTGAATLNVDSLGAKSIVKNHDVALASGDIEANQIVAVVYNATDDVYELLSGVANAISAGSGIALSSGTISADPNNATDTAIATGDEVLFGDVSDSNNVKKDTVQGILDLVPSSGDATSGLIETATQAEMESATATDKAVTPGRTKFHPGVAKAWVRFNGTGTPSVTHAYNVSSITDNGTGMWTVNLSPTISSNPCVSCVSNTDGNIWAGAVDGAGVGVNQKSAAGSFADSSDVYVIVMGDAP